MKEKADAIQAEHKAQALTVKKAKAQNALTAKSLWPQSEAKINQAIAEVNSKLETVRLRLVSDVHDSPAPAVAKIVISLISDSANRGESLVVNVNTLGTIQIIGRGLSIPALQIGKDSVEKYKAALTDFVERCMD